VTKSSLSLVAFISIAGESRLRKSPFKQKNKNKNRRRKESVELLRFTFEFFYQPTAIFGCASVWCVFLPSRSIGEPNTSTEKAKKKKITKIKTIKSRKTLKKKHRPSLQPSGKIENGDGCLDDDAPDRMSSLSVRGFLFSFECTK